MQQPGAATEQQQSAFDLPRAIASFAADASRTSLELPAGLSAAQRREAKQIADQLGGLKCESYGFGAERQLHLFKKSTLADGPAADAVRIKNTFIDDWLAEGASSAEPPHHRSLPPGLFAHSAESIFGPCTSSAAEMSPIVEASPQSTSAGDASASTSKVRGTRLDFGFAAELPELPVAHKYSVKDTFIHIEEYEPTAAERRAVQSMPDGSFQRHLQAELAAMQQEAREQQQLLLLQQPASQQPLPAAVPAPPAAEQVPEAVEQITVGAQVVIDGLLKLPDFNGCSGVVQSFDPATGRYAVLLDAPAGAAGHRNAKVKRDNLRPKMQALALPPPPLYAPTLLSKQGLLATGARVACAASCSEDLRMPAAAAAAAAGLPVKPLKLESLV